MASGFMEAVRVIPASDRDVAPPSSPISPHEAADFDSIRPLIEPIGHQATSFCLTDIGSWPTVNDSVQFAYEGHSSPASQHEYARGRYEYVELYTNEVVKLSQVRKERNKVSAELKNDIYEKSQGDINSSLINQLDAVHVKADLFKDYLEFVETTWGSSAEIEDFEDLRDADGKYYLLAAGHSRHLSIEELEEEHVEDGTFPRVPIVHKVHEVKTVWDIITIQIGENIYNKPPQERRAIAIVEAYYYGLGKEGYWNNEAEFLASGKIENVTEGAFAEAMHFARLPYTIRNFVLAGPVQYKVGVELGLTVGPLAEYLKATHPDDLLEDKLKDMVTRELAILVDTIVEQKKTIEGATTYLTGQRSQWRDIVKSLKNPRDGEFKLEMICEPDRTLDQQQRRLNEVLRSLGRRRGQELMAMLELNSEVVGEAAIDPLLRDAIAANNQATATLSKRAQIAADKARREAEDATFNDEQLLI